MKKAIFIVWFITIFIIPLYVFAYNAEWSDYVNDVDEPIDFTCPKGRYLAGVESFHHNRSEDRRFNFLCADYPPTPSVESIGWSGYINEMDGPFNYQCPEGLYIAGITSEHHNHSEDRYFSFLCATYRPSSEEMPGRWSNYVNRVDEYFKFECQPGYYIRGIRSKHYNRSEDRIFAFLCAPYYKSQ